MGICSSHKITRKKLITRKLFNIHFSSILKVAEWIYKLNVIQFIKWSFIGSTGKVSRHEHVASVAYDWNIDDLISRRWSMVRCDHMILEQITASVLLRWRRKSFKMHMEQNSKTGSKGGIWDRESNGGRGGIRDQEGAIWDHSPGIRDQRPWDRDQQFF